MLEEEILLLKTATTEDVAVFNLGLWRGKHEYKTDWELNYRNELIESFSFDFWRNS